MNVIKGMMNSLWRTNDLGYKPNGAKRYLAANDQVVAIEKKLAGGLSVDDLSEEEYKILSAHDKAESAAFNAQVTEMFSKAEKIAMKIAKGEKLTPEEEQLMNEKFPDLKREAEQAKKEGEDLKERIKAAKTREEKQQIASGAMQSISSQMSKGTMAPIQAAVKMAATQKAIEEAEKEDEESKGLTRNAMNQSALEPGSFLNIRA
ncbi:MAG: hypothetical protein ACRDDX_06030 [Cellulosilyticaceae bacterium]